MICRVTATPVSNTTQLQSKTARDTGGHALALVWHMRMALTLAVAGLLCGQTLRTTPAPPAASKQIVFGAEMARQMEERDGAFRDAAVHS